MIDFEAAMVGTVPVAGTDRLDGAALERWLRDYVQGFAGPLSLTRFKGGQSNPTYRIDTPGRSYVLRRQPFGDLLPSAHAVDREYRVIAALHPTGFPVPVPYGLCEDRAVIGAKFYVMGLAEGRNLWNGALPAADPAERRAIYHAMTDTLAALHRVRPADVGLADYGKPGDYCVRQMARWTKQYRLAETGPLPVIDRLIDWLAATIPPQVGEGIVHGDYRLDNLIFAPDEPRVIAVLDWELSTLGDPVADFAYFLMNWVMPPDGRAGIAGLDWAALGIPGMEETRERYEAATGITIPALEWYLAFNLFRLAAIVQGIKKRMLEGNASSPQSAEMVKMIEPLAQAGWEWAVKAGAG